MRYVSIGDDIAKGKTFIGNTGFFLTGETPMEVWFFQFAFVCALSSIAAGTFAERCKMTAYLCYFAASSTPSALIHFGVLMDFFHPLPQSRCGEWMVAQ